MRAAALDERRSLPDPEAVLLVDDRDGEVPEVDLLLDQRVRPHHELCITRSQQLADEPSASRADRGSNVPKLELR